MEYFDDPLEKFEDHGTAKSFPPGYVLNCDSAGNDTGPALVSRRRRRGEDPSYGELPYPAFLGVSTVSRRSPDPSESNRSRLPRSSMPAHIATTAARAMAPTKNMA